MLTTYIVTQNKMSPENKTAKTCLEYLGPFLISVKGVDSTPEGLVARVKKEDRHTTLANIEDPCIDVETLALTWTGIRDGFNKHSSDFNIDDNYKFRPSTENDNINIHMAWPKDCILSDDIRKVHAFVVESEWFGKIMLTSYIMTRSVWRNSRMTAQWRPQMITKSTSTLFRCWEHSKHNMEEFGLLA